MTRPFARLLVLIAAVQILGGHWAVLQTLAWTGMLIENVRTAPLTEAVAKTFDGSKPCHLCVAVQEGRKSEEQRTMPKQLVKLEAVVAEEIAACPVPVIHGYAYPAFDFSFGSRGEAPQLPPPRLA